MDETKTPKPGEWWIADDGSIAYIIGTKRNGHVIFEDPDGAHFNGDTDWEDWRHEPRCDSFEWVEPPAVDPATKALHELAINAGFDPLALDPEDIAEKIMAKQKPPERIPDHRPARDVISRH